MPIVKDYLGYTQKWKKEYGEKTIVLMQCGSFFEVYAAKNKEGQFYGSDIVAFSTICDMIIAPKSKMFHNKDQVHMAGFGLAQLDKYVKRLDTRLQYIFRMCKGRTQRAVSPKLYLQEHSSRRNPIRCRMCLCVSG